MTEDFKPDALRLHLTPEQVEQVRTWRDPFKRLLVIGAAGHDTPLNWSVVLWEVEPHELRNGLIASEVMAGKLKRRRKRKEKAK